MSFEKYTDCILNAFRSHPKASDVIKRKKEILQGVSEFHNLQSESVLYFGFNPAILADNSEDIYVTHISDDACNFLKANNIKFNLIPKTELTNHYKKFEVVVALDEFFTFVNSDQEQRDLIEQVCNLTSEYLVTTCKDYKNQDFKDREFSTPAIIRTPKTNLIYLEFHDHDLNDRNSWKTYVHQINNVNMNMYGGFNRRSVFFKQLAKFSSDVGSVGFSVHKNLMYKSLIKKNYEHVISIRFDYNGY